MKQTQQAPSSTAGAPAREPSAISSEQPARRFKSTAEILSRGVSLAQVQQAVRRLRPQVHQAG